MVVPAGYKFRPSDEHLLGFFLKNRVTNGASANPSMIYECDLYGEEEPWQVWAKYRPVYEGLFEGGTVDEDSDLYFFTKLKKKDPAHKRVVRRVGPSEGTWHGYNVGKTIRAHGMGLVIGITKMFTYKNPKSEQSGNWIMHEYTLSNSDDVVLCRLRRKHEAPVPQSVEDQMSTADIFFTPNHLIQAGAEQNLVELDNQVIDDEEIFGSLPDLFELEPLEKTAPRAVHGGDIYGGDIYEDCTWTDLYRISCAHS